MRGRPFEPGNKIGRGRPPGSPNKVSRKVQHTLEEHSEALTKKCVFMALQGDSAAMRLCMERLMPARRQRLLRFRLPKIQSIAEVPTALEAVLTGVARGYLTPGEGQAFSEILERRRQVFESVEAETRLRNVENLCAKN